MEIVQKEAFKVVGIKVIADWDKLWVEMPKTWQEFIPRGAEIKNKVRDTFVDITLRKDGDHYTQVIAAEVSAFDDVPEGMITLEIPSQKYVYYEHVGPVQDIAASFGKMYEWAELNDYPVDEFNLDMGYTHEGLEQEHELFIRVRA